VKYPTLDEADLEARKVFLRADLNVPLENGKVTDDTRIRGMIPTLKLLLERGASVVVASHLGRPGGKVNPEYSLAPVADVLEEIMGISIAFAPDCIGAHVDSMRASMKPGDVLLLENLRFNPGEEKCDDDFARSLAGDAQVYVNDAFGTSHRSHASMVGVPRILGGGYIGLLVQKELEAFERVLTVGDEPFTLVLGGAKVSDKIQVIEHLLPRLNNILVGGGMAFTFMKCKGLEIGESLLDVERLEAAGRIMSEAERRGVRIVLPVDVVTAPSLDAADRAETVPADAMPRDGMGLDIGPETVREFGRVIAESAVVVWNGPLGVFEIPPFDKGTTAVALAVAEASDKGAFTVVGGGDLVRAVHEAGVSDRIGYVSTGGGASLRLLQGMELPALAALKGART